MPDSRPEGNDNERRGTNISSYTTCMERTKNVERGPGMFFLKPFLLS